MRLKTILVVLMALMFLTTSLFSVAFSKSVLTEETKLTHKGESPQTTRATDGDSTLNQKEPNRASDFSGGRTEENSAKSRIPDIFPFNSFVKDISTHKTDMWRDLAKVDGDSAELVVGLNNAQPDSYVKISDLVVENGGKLVNTVSTEDEVIAVVADLPLDLVSSFTEDVQASNLARYIEPNMKYQTQLVPNDPYWTLQWGPQKIEADYAWNTTIGDSSVLVAVIDTGIDYDHPDLAANYVPLGYDWVNGDSDPMDDEGHGTHCAGIIAAELNNEIGVAGVAQVSIMAEKGLNQYGSGYEDDLAYAIVDAVDQGADILSNSWGGYSESQLIYDAVKYAYDKGVLVVAAAGNEAWNNKLYPAAYDEVIAVTATDDNDDPASFTNFGEWVEVAAPGVEIYSTVLNDSYTWKSGTSMACPHVSGVAALIWSQFPNMTRDQVRAQLWYTTDDLGDPGFDEYYGYGRINARRAVEQAPPEHDLLIFDWEKPKSIQPEDYVSLNVTVLNFGANDENDVTVQLLVDENLTNSTLISSLANGTSTTVSLSWNPLAERTYNVTLYIVPVLGETVIENNVVSAMVSVRYARFVLWDDVHDGDGDSLTLNYLSLYELLISNGFVVDELTSGTINSGLLASYDILVLIDPEYDFLSSEITDINNWVATGGALIIIPDAGYPPTLAQIMAPYSVQLTGWDTYYGTTTNIILHPITWDVGSIYYDRAWELDVTSPCEALAWSLENYAFLSVTGNEVVVLSDSNIMDNYGLGMDDNTQLMLNIFNWIGVRYEHELTVYLDAPSYLMPGESSQLNATVYNRGLNNETNVELQLLINGTIENEVTIPKLVNGTSYTIDYEWTPTTEATYNVTTYAPPVAEENVTINNVATKFVAVTYPLIRPIEGQWANYIMNYYDASGRIIGTGYWNFTYDHYVEPYLIYITCSFIDPSVYNVTDWMIVNIMNRMVESGIWAGVWYPGWIETDITIGSTINLLAGTATVNGSKIIPVNMYPIDCWELPFWTYEYPYTFWYDKISGLWIGMEYIDPYYNQRSELLLVNTNIPIGTIYENELAAALEAPHFLEPSDTSLLNATVHNLGSSTETDVELQLLINGTQVDSVTIPELPNGTSYTISYLWTPLVEATYNITAHALPVLGENITINNAATQLVNVKIVKGYVLFDQTHWTDSIFNYNIWVTDLIDRGYIVDTLTTSPITQPMLEDHDIFVIPQANDYYSSDELSAIQNFVLDGGGLLVIGDDAPYIYTDLTSFAGITWDWGGDGKDTNDITPHPVTEGVTTAYFGSPGLIRVAYPAQDIIRDNYGNVMLAVSEVGLGAVIGIADENSIDNYHITFADNQRLANNMIDWLKSRRPVASFTYSPLDPYVGETVTFNASASYDPDGTIESYIWNFGDDSSGEGNITTHLYAAGGTYTVTLTVIDNENLNSNSTTEITVSRTTIDIEIDVGSTHFRGEIAEFYILVSTLGNPVDASISATLYYSGTIYEDLSASIEHIGSGFYRIPYTIPVDDSPGTYALLVEARYLSLSGVSLKSFLLSPTLTEWNAWLIDIQGDIATIKTDIGTIKVSLEDINLRLEDIEERLPFQKTIVATIDTEIGVIWVDLADINAVLTSIDGRIATVDTDIGLMQVDISKINAELITLSGTTATIKSDLGTITTDIANIRLKVTEISEDTATIETTFGTFTGEVTSIEKDLATIETDFGTVKVNIGNIEEIQSTYAVPLNLVLLSWIIIAAGAILLAVFLRRKRS